MQSLRTISFTYDLLTPTIGAKTRIAPNRRSAVSVKLEHANLCVRDIDVMIRFLKTAFPEFRVRADRTGADGERWVHFGTDHTYLALSAADAEADRDWEPYSGLPGVNHLGYEVDDADALRTRMLAAGYK